MTCPRALSGAAARRRTPRSRRRGGRGSWRRSRIIRGAYAPPGPALAGPQATVREPEPWALPRRRAGPARLRQRALDAAAGHGPVPGRAHRATVGSVADEAPGEGRGGRGRAGPPTAEPDRIEPDVSGDQSPGTSGAIVGLVDRVMGPAVAASARQRARAAIAEHAHAYRNLPVAVLGAGLDHHAFLVGDLVVRVGADVVGKAALLRLIGERLSLPVPRPRFVDPLRKRAGLPAVARPCAAGPNPARGRGGAARAHARGATRHQPGRPRRPAAVTDPALDFARHYRDFGPTFLDETLRAYGRDSPAFRRRITFFARCAAGGPRLRPPGLHPRRHPQPDLAVPDYAHAAMISASTPAKPVAVYTR